MALEQEIDGIQEGIKAGRFPNEASISQGIVLRLLHGLGWPAYDTQIICPEYRLSGTRVDYALCNPPNKPIAIIEVKQLGHSDGAERQLFEYAFHDGLRRYLLFSDVVSGAAIQAARDDYKNVSKDRQMLATLPKAWSQIIEDEEEMLLEILADRVESLCGFKPGPDMVAKFLKGSTTKPPPVAQGISRPTRSNENKANLPTSPVMERLTRTATGSNSQSIGFTIDNVFYPARNAIDVLRQIFETLSEKDPSFPDRFSALALHGRSRRYLSRDANELYPNRPDLCRDASVKLKSGFWLGTNHSRQSIAKILALAQEVAARGKGKDFHYNLGQ